MKRLLYIIVICLIAASCDRRELTYDYNEYCNVTVNVDWSALSETPSGMSLYFYPQDGSSPTVKSTNDVDSYVVSLKEGIYDVLIFNYSTNEYGSLSFSGMDSFDTAMVQLTETKSDWYSTKADETVARTPEDLAVKTYKDFEITSEMVDETTKLKSQLQSKSSTKSVSVFSMDVTPQVIITTMIVNIKIEGLHNMLSAQGSMGGMSAGYYFASQTTHSDRVTHLLEDWSTEFDAGSTTNGYVRTVFSTFGLPETSVTTRTSDDWEGKLWTKFTLVDNTTEVEMTTRVTTDHLTSDISGEVTTMQLTLELGTGAESDPLEGNTMVLPDVTPAGSGGGFSADVDDWGEREDVNIEL